MHTSPGPPPSVTRVLIGDPHPVVRHGVRALISAEPDLLVVGEAGGAEELLDLARVHEPDVVVTDCPMPGAAGTRVAARLYAGTTRRRVLVLTAHADQQVLGAVLADGAAGYVLKCAPTAELVRAVRAVAGGALCYPPAGTAALNECEALVLRFVALGYSNKQIAARLRRSAKTVDGYKARSLAKAGLSSRADVVRYAAQQGWLGTNPV